MSDTPRTDSARDYSCPEKMDDECQKLERELNAANARIAELSKQLSESEALLYDRVIKCGNLELQLAEARKDGERLDYFEAMDGVDAIHCGDIWWLKPTGEDSLGDFPSLREAIDAARKENA